MEHMESSGINTMTRKYYTPVMRGKNQRKKQNCG